FQLYTKRLCLASSLYPDRPPLRAKYGAWQPQTQRNPQKGALSAARRGPFYNIKLHDFVVKMAVAQFWPKSAATSSRYLLPSHRPFGGGSGARSAKPLGDSTSRCGMSPTVRAIGIAALVVGWAAASPAVGQEQPRRTASRLHQDCGATSRLRIPNRSVHIQARLCGPPNCEKPCATWASWQPDFESSRAACVVRCRAEAPPRCRP